MKKTFSTVAIAALLAGGVFVGSANAQLAITTAGSPVSTNFDGFLGDGFASPPGTGQADSSIWRITGMSDGAGTFGGTHGSDDPRDDFSRGFSTGGVTSGGTYAFDTGSVTILGVQPTGADFTPGEITLRAINNTGDSLDEFEVSYDIWYLNDQPRANSLNFAFSTNDSVYTAVPSADFTTPEAADAVPAWQLVSRTATVSAFVPDGEFVYFQWQGNDVSGSGSRDEYGITNISITGTTTGVVPDPELVSAYSVAPDVIRASLTLTPDTIDPSDFTLTDSQSAATISAVNLVEGSVYDLTLSAPLTDTLQDTLTYDPSSTSATFIGGITDPINFRNGTIGTGELITVAMTVTAISGSNIATQATVGDPAGRGMVLFSGTLAGQLEVDDEIVVVGTTSQFNQGGSLRNQLDNMILISSEPGTPPLPVIVPSADFESTNPAETNPAEQYEGVLITINSLTYVTALGFGEHQFMGPGSTSNITVPTFFPGTGFNYIDGETYNITGIGFESFDAYKIAPRSADDIDGLESVSDWLLH